MKNNLYYLQKKQFKISILILFNTSLIYLIAYKNVYYDINVLMYQMLNSNNCDSFTRVFIYFVIEIVVVVIMNRIIIEKCSIFLYFVYNVHTNYMYNFLEVYYRRLYIIISSFNNFSTYIYVLYFNMILIFS